MSIWRRKKKDPGLPKRLPSHVDRAIVWARFAPPQGIVFLCDCGLTTEAQFSGEVEEGVEVAITCDRCTTVYWFTVHLGSSEASRG